mgnify:CR=1 FL=1
MRAFLALPIEENLKEAVYQKIEFFRKNITSRVKWVEKENLHFTIFFFGEIDEKKKNEIIKIAESKNFKKIKICLNSISYFPSDKNPRVIFYKLKEGEEKIKEIYDTFFEPFSKILRLKKEDFKAHLTIGRVKERLDEKDIKFLKENEFEFKTSFLYKIILFESILKPEGPIYNPIKEFHLL